MIKLLILTPSNSDRLILWDFNPNSAVKMLKTLLRLDDLSVSTALESLDVLS